MIDLVKEKIEKVRTHEERDNYEDICIDYIKEDLSIDTKNIQEMAKVVKKEVKGQKHIKEVLRDLMVKNVTD